MRSTLLEGMRYMGSIQAGLLSEIQGAWGESKFREGMARHAVLAECDSVEMLLARIGRSDDGSCSLQERMTRALLVEFQTTSESVWASVLTLGYFPLLVSLLMCLESKSLPERDLVHLVLESFLIAVNLLSLSICEGQTALHIKQRTRQRVFGRIRYERQCRRGEGVFMAYEKEERRSVGLWRDAQACEAAHSLVEELSREEEGFEDRGVGCLSLLLMGRGGGRALREEIAQKHPYLSPRGREQMYERVKRQRSRLLTRLRGGIHPIGPIDTGSNAGKRVEKSA